MATKSLIVGIDFYTNNATNLTTCVNDANAWEKILTKKIKNDLSIKKLTKFDETDADTILSEFETLVESLNPSDTGIFIFSGHGLLRKYNCQNDQSCIIEERIRAQDREIPDISLINRLKELDNKAKLIVIIDSCFSGGVQLLNNYLVTDIKPLSNEIIEIKTYNNFDNDLSENITHNNINKTFASNNIIFISACGPNELAYAKKNQLSVFTEYSVNILEKSEEITYKIFESEIRKFLPNNTLGFNQTPTIKTGNQNPENIFFN